MYRSRKGKLLFGVIAGLAKLIGMKDPGLLRVIFIVSIFFTSGALILVYFLMAMFIPYDHAEDIEIKEKK